MYHKLIITLLLFCSISFGQSGKSVLTNAQKDSIKQLYSDTYSVYSLDNYAGANDSIKLANALSELDENATIYFPEGTHDVGAQTIDCNVIIAKGGIITTNYGSVKFTGTIQDCIYQIFEIPTTVSEYYLLDKIDIRYAKIDKVRPEWWGAVVNDNTSDRKPIQMALNTGKSIHYIGGTYLLDSTIVAQSRTTWQGEGGLRGEDIRTSTRADGTVIKLMDESNVKMVDIQGAHIGLAIRDITFKGNKDNQSVPCDIMEIHNPIVRVENCTFDSSSRHGIYLNSNTYNSIQVIISGNTFYNIDSAGVYTEGSGTGLHILNNAFDGCQYGAYINSSDWGSFQNNNLEICMYGIKTKGTFVIENNYFTRSDSAAIYMMVGGRAFIGKQHFNLCGVNIDKDDNAFGNKILYDISTDDATGLNWWGINILQKDNIIVPASDSAETFTVPVSFQNDRRRIRYLSIIPQQIISANDSIYCKLELKINTTSFGSITFNDTTWYGGSEYNFIDYNDNTATFNKGAILKLYKTLTRPDPTVGDNEIPDSASTFGIDGTDWWTGARVALTWDADSLYMVATVNDTSGSTDIIMDDSLTINQKYKISFRAKTVNATSSLFSSNVTWKNWAVVKNPTISSSFQDYEFTGYAQRVDGIIHIQDGYQDIGDQWIFDTIKVEPIISEKGMETPNLLIYVEYGE